MKALLPLAVALLTACAATHPSGEKSAPPTAQHAWLHQLVGEWEVTSETVMEPGAEPIVWTSHDSVRSLGGLWVLIEGAMESEEQSFHTRMTLGYDPDLGTFVGSYVDSMQTQLWTYTGTLDEAARVLTLEATGPAMHDPTQTGRYRDQIELVSPDEKRMVSSAVDADGNWFTFMEMVGRRVD